MFPLLLIPLAIVNIVVFLMSGVSLDAPVYTVTLPSLANWTFTASDALLAFSLLLLMLEIGKSARPGAKYFTDHFLSLLIFVGAAAEFLMLKPFGTSTFLLLTLMTFVSFIGGVMVRARRPKLVAAAAPVPVPVEPPPAVVTPAPVVVRTETKAETKAEREPIVAQPMPNPVVTPAPVVHSTAEPAVYPANDLDITPSKEPITGAEKRPDMPTVIPQR